MTCTFSKEEQQMAIRFHGHNCPGLTIGIRAAELALKELDHPDNGDMVAISETDMCGVDAIQFFTGCTLGKGNLLMKDHGKMAFSFFDRKTKRGFRCVLKGNAWGELGKELEQLMSKITSGLATAEDIARNKELRAALISHILTVDLKDMFDLTWLDSEPPRPARVLASLVCEACGEKTMESRTRRFDGKTLCIPCFDKVEQKR